MNLLPQASTIATSTDKMFLYLFVISAAFLAFITALMIYFVIRYGKKRHPKSEQIEGNVLLEATWTVAPLLLFVGIFYFGWTGYDYTRRAPRDAMVVKVTARQWTWSFEYPNGKRTDQLYAVINRPMKFETQSLDVIHGLYIPAFRIKIRRRARSHQHNLVPTDRTWVFRHSMYGHLRRQPQFYVKSCRGRQ